MKPIDLATVTERPHSPIDQFRFHDCTCGIGCYTGRPPWERHPAGDELLHVLGGEQQLTMVVEEGPVTFELCAGALIVVPRGVWHRSLAPSGVTVLFVTPTEENEHSFDDAPPGT